MSVQPVQAICSERLKGWDMSTKMSHYYKGTIQRWLQERIAEVFAVCAADGLLVAGIAWH
ncbi:MAG: hypothetical protein FDX02_06205 [Chlorobium sp.]|nr:MAG: hypothetical protein FDX02_06205 [Chlorobium sp.]